MDRDGPEDRCCYTTPYAETVTSIGNMTCWREVWKDGRCIWHADVDDKPIESLVEARTTVPERLDYSILRGLNLTDSISFANCTLWGADFSNSDIRRANFFEANLSAADFTNAVLEEADLSWATLDRTDLSEAQLLQADLTAAKVQAAKFVAADAIFTNFSQTNAEYTDFSKTNLNGAIFDRAKIHQTKFVNVRVDSATDHRTIYTYDTPQMQLGDVEVVLDWIHLQIQTALHYLKPARWRDNSLTEPEKAARVHRMLQRILRENDLPADIPHHYIREKHARRRQAIKERFFIKWLSLSSARWTTLYGESPWRVVYSGLTVIFLCALLYPFTGGVQVTSGVEGPAWLKRLYFSTVTFTTLGYGDLHPQSQLAQLLAMTESLIGAALMALLVAVLTRRITR